MTREHIKNLVFLSLCLAISLVIYMVEELITLPINMPGLKLGMANIITIILIKKPKEAFSVHFLRIILGSVLAGHGISFLYAIFGGLFAFFAILITYKFVGKNIWFCGVMGAVFHNLGQILVAVVLLGTFAIYWFAVIIFTGIITGIFTGLVSQLLLKKINLINKS